MKNTDNNTPRQISPFDLCSQAKIEMYVRGELSGREAQKIRAIIELIPELQAYETKLEQALDLEVKLSPKADRNLLNMLANLDKDHPLRVIFFPLIMLSRGLADHLQYRKKSLAVDLTALLAVAAMLIFFALPGVTKSKQKKVPDQITKSKPLAIRLPEKTREVKGVKPLPGRALVSPRDTRKTENALAIAKHKDLLPIVPPDVTPRLPGANKLKVQTPQFTSYKIEAKNVSSSSELNWNIQEIKEIQKHYQKTEKKYLKAAKILDLFNKKVKSENRKDHRKKSMPKGVSSKRAKAKARKFAKRRNAKAKKRGRKRARLNYKKRRLAKEMLNLQKQAIGQTLVVLGTRENKVPAPLDKKLSTTGLQGILLGFALPNAPNETLYFQLFLLEEKTNKKRLLAKATLKAATNQVVKQYLPLGKASDYLQAGWFIIKISKKSGRRFQQLSAYRFELKE